jgi:hypothetical protein
VRPARPDGQKTGNGDPLPDEDGRQGSSSTIDFRVCFVLFDQLFDRYEGSRLVLPSLPRGAKAIQDPERLIAIGDMGADHRSDLPAARPTLNPCHRLPVAKQDERRNLGYPEGVRQRPRGVCVNRHYPEPASLPAGDHREEALHSARRTRGG